MDWGWPWLPLPYLEDAEVAEFDATLGDKDVDDSVESPLEISLVSSCGRSSSSAMDWTMLFLVMAWLSRHYEGDMAASTTRTSRKAEASQKQNASVGALHALRSGGYFAMSLSVFSARTFTLL